MRKDTGRQPEWIRPEGTIGNAPPYTSKLTTNPTMPALLEAIQQAGKANVGIISASANPLAAPCFPIPRSARTGQATAYGIELAIIAASNFWPGETKWILAGADLRRSGKHPEGTPPGSELYRELVELQAFTADEK